MVASFSRRLAVVFGACGAAGALAAAACVIADPPPDLPAPPLHHPVIVTGSVNPPTTAVLTEIPRRFDVPVEVLTPDREFFYNVFVDYDPVSRPGAVIHSRAQP